MEATRPAQPALPCLQHRAEPCGTPGRQPAAARGAVAQGLLRAGAALGQAAPALALPFSRLRAAAQALCPCSVGCSGRRPAGALARAGDVLAQGATAAQPHSGDERAQLGQSRSSPYLPYLPKLTWEVSGQVILPGRTGLRQDRARDQPARSQVRSQNSTKGRRPGASQPWQPERGTQLAASGPPAPLPCATAVLPLAAGEDVPVAPVAPRCLCLLSSTTDNSSLLATHPWHTNAARRG